MATLVGQAAAPAVTLALANAHVGSDDGSDGSDDSDSGDALPPPPPPLPSSVAVGRATRVALNKVSAAKFSSVTLVLDAVAARVASAADGLAVVTELTAALSDGELFLPVYARVAAWFCGTGPLTEAPGQRAPPLAGTAGPPTGGGATVTPSPPLLPPPPRGAVPSIRALLLATLFAEVAAVSGGGGVAARLRALAAAADAEVAAARAAPPTPWPWGISLGRGSADGRVAAPRRAILPPTTATTTATTTTTAASAAAASATTAAAGVRPVALSALAASLTAAAT